MGPSAGKSGVSLPEVLTAWGLGSNYQDWSSDITYYELVDGV